MDTARNEIILDGEWRFAYTKDAPNSRSDMPSDDEYEIEMPVPAYWDDCKSRLKYARFWSRGCSFNPDWREIEEFPLGGLKPPDASLPYLLGTGWYKKNFTADKSWKNCCAELCLDGAMLDAWVWLNGNYIGTHYSCGKPFSFSVEQYIKYDEENELIVAVSNIRKDRIGCSIRGFKGKSAGINGSVRLEISRKGRIADCYVRTTEQLDRLIWNVQVRSCNVANEFSKEKENEQINEETNEQVKEQTSRVLRWKIINPASGNVLGSGTTKVDNTDISFETDTFGMQPWSDKNPVLYTLQAELIENEEILDTVKQSFGMRFLTRKGTSIYLNNKPIFLRGTTDHAYFPETCTVSNDLSYYMRNIKALKAAGFNWMRFHTTVPPKECMEAADRLGMLIQAETQNGFEEQDFLDMLMLGRKHPSVILYCCGNEVPITDEFEKQLEKMAENCHRLAPDSLYDPMEALLNVECLVEETDPGYKALPIPYNAEKLNRLREYSDVLATGVWVFSYHSLYADIEKINERMAIYERPCLIHEAGIFDTYLNLDLEKRYEGKRIGTDLFRAVRQYVTEMGVLEKAPLYYQNSCKWMKLLMKFALEKARRCPYAAGYDFLGAIDCHWHRTGYATGVMNEFYELKAGFTTRELQQFNGESILVSDAGHERSLYTGEERMVELFASLYSGEALEKGMLTWAIVDDQNIVRASGSKEVTAIEDGKTTSLGTIPLVLDRVHGTGEHIRLIAQLTGGIYHISNEWDYWVFQKPEETHENSITVTDHITESDVRDMENGKRILLLGSGPFGGIPITFQITPGGRVHGNCATVIYDHPLMRNFPQDGFCDWQFMPLFHDAGAVVFNELEMSFNPIVEIVSTYKMINKQAAVFEVGIGKGGLLVCTLNVKAKDPAAEVLYRNMIHYLESDEFAPKTTLHSEKLLEIMKKNINLHVDFTTDECYDTGGYIEV